MSLLSTLLGHDAWTTRQLLLRCEGLSADELDRRLQIDYQSARALLQHMIGNMEVWTDLMLDRPARPRADSGSLDELSSRHEAASAEFSSLARRIEAEGRLSSLWVDHLDTPPTSKTLGDGILHVITHDMHHRAHVLLVLGWLGLNDLPEGDVFSWKQDQTT